MAKVEDCPGFETFGEDVRAAREALGLTIKALAEQVYIEADHSKHPCHAAVGANLPSADSVSANDKMKENAEEKM